MTTAKTEIVVDTNVAVVANGHTPQANLNCRSKCITRLRQVMDGFRILLDDRNLILGRINNLLAPDD